MERNNKGFSVVELVVSLALLALIFIPISNFFTNSFKVQGRSAVKTSITRVSQHIMENFKNKNYLPNELKDAEGKTFSDFITGITLKNNGTEESPKYELENSSAENIIWNMKYKGIDYLVSIKIDGFKMSDMSEFEIPTKDKWGGYVIINESGHFDNASYAEEGLTNLGGIERFEVGESFYNPIDGKIYTADCLTIILDDRVINNFGDAILWIDNQYANWEQIRIIQNFDGELQVYVAGNDLSILNGLYGDGASSAQTRITSFFAGEEVDLNSEVESELLLETKMIISYSLDTSLKDSFDFSFPIKYDYSE